MREAGSKVATAARGIARADRSTAWIHRFIYGELAERAKTRGPEYWDRLFPGAPPEERAERRIRRMLTRATIAAVAAAGGVTASELLSMTDVAVAPVALPIGIACMGAELLYTTALQIDLAFDLASIYGVPFATDDVGEISTLLAMGLGVGLLPEPTRHDKPAPPGETKRWRVVRQMGRPDFAAEVGTTLVERSVLRNVVPIAGIVVSGAWDQVALRRFARDVHATVRARRALVQTCRGMRLGTADVARRILDGAWLLATADGELHPSEALALSTLIDTLALPERIAVHEASFCDDEEVWFEHLPALDEADRDRLIDVLSLVAAADGHVDTPERRFLRRVSRTLDRDVDFAAVDRLCAQLSAGEHPPAAASPAIVARPVGLAVR